MYWFPTMHKNPLGSRFIIASKNCSIKPLIQAVSLIFKMIFNTFHNKSIFYSCHNRVWLFKILLRQINDSHLTLVLYVLRFHIIFC